MHLRPALTLDARPRRGGRRSRVRRRPAKSFTLPQADVRAGREERQRSLVDERITYAFSGPFTGGYRDIPLRKGESIAMSRSRERHGYRPGAVRSSAVIHPPGTYGVLISATARIVWHYSASDELRTFQLHYTLKELAVAYDDVVDVNLHVWGNEWRPLGQLPATYDRAGPGRPRPGDIPSTCAATSARRPTRVLRALDVPARQFVELRALFPRSAFTSTAGMQVVRGRRPAKIVAEERADAAAYERTTTGSRTRSTTRGLAVYVLAARLVPALLVVAGVLSFFGRERRTGYDREYEQEPPTDTQPALVPTLLRQGGEAGSFEFTATLFDLIRRGVFASTPVTTERSTWGGLHKEQRRRSGALGRGSATRS